MSDNNGKVILSLLAGAAAGVVTGLLLAPETGEATRNSFKKAAGDLGGDLNKFFQDALSKARAATSQDAPNEDAAVSEDRAAADNLFNSMNTGSTVGDSAASHDSGTGQTAGADSKGDNATTAGL